MIANCYLNLKIKHTDFAAWRSTFLAITPIVTQSTSDEMDMVGRITCNGRNLLPCISDDISSAETKHCLNKR